MCQETACRNYSGDTDLSRVKEIPWKVMLLDELVNLEICFYLPE